VTLFLYEGKCVCLAKTYSRQYAKCIAKIVMSQNTNINQIKNLHVNEQTNTETLKSFYKEPYRPLLHISEKKLIHLLTFYFMFCGGLKLIVHMLNSCTSQYEVQTDESITDTKFRKLRKSGHLFHL